MRKRIIPPSQRNNKNYLWDSMGGIGVVEILIIGLSIIIGITVLLLTNIKIGIVIMIILLIIAFLLIKTDPKTKQKGYETFLGSFYFLSVKKKYNDEDIQKQLDPFKFDDEEKRISVGKNFYINTIKLDGRDIEKLSLEEREELITSYAEIIKNVDVSISFYKESIKPDNSLQVKALEVKKEKILKDKKITKKNKEKAIRQLNSYILEEYEKTYNKKVSYKLVLSGTAEDVYEATNNLVEDLKLINIHSTILSYEEQKEFIKRFSNLSNKPENISFHRNYVKQDDTYYRFISISKKPLYSNDGWFSSFCYFDNVIPCLKIMPIKDQEAANKNLDKAIQINEIKLSRVGRTSAKQKNEILTINEIYREIIEGINSDSDKMLDLLPLFRIEAESVSELNKTERNLRKFVKADGFDILSLPNYQFHAYESFMPKRTSLLRNKLSIEVPTITAASAFPFIVDDFIDPGGIFLSRTSQGGEIYWNDEMRDDYRFNSNAIILGSSGSGKSVTTYKLVLNDYLKGNKIFIIDPEQEYINISKELGGNVLDMGGTGGNKINPLQIPSAFDDEDSKHIQKHASFLNSFFETTNKNISQEVGIIIQTEIIAFYKFLKITDTKISNSYSKINWPIFQDFYKYLKTKARTKTGNMKDIYDFALIIISQYCDGGTYSDLWNQKQTIDFKEKFVVFDTSALINNKYKIAGQMLFITKIIWSSIQENKVLNEKKNINNYTSLYIDEAHLLMNKSNLFALEWIQMITKRIRKYNGKLFLITQNVKDFLGDKEISHLTEGIINNISYSFIGKMQPKDLESLSNMYATTGGLSETEKQWIINSGRGKFLLKIGDRLKYFIERVHINPSEAEMFSKDILRSYDTEYIKEFNKALHEMKE